jgi:hypothetical protein
MIFMPNKKKRLLLENEKQNTLKCEKLTDDRCKVMAKAHIAFGKVS